MTGYAEGGYVTAQTQSVMENDSTKRMDITASAEGGGLMVLGVYLYYIHPGRSNSSRSPYFLPMLIRGFHSAYGWTRPLTDYLSPTSATKLSSLFDGTKTVAEINAAIKASPDDFRYNPVFESFTLVNSSGYPEFLSALDNSTVHFLTSNNVPKAKTMYYSDTPDEITATASMMYLMDTYQFPKYKDIVSFRSIDKTIPSNGNAMVFDSMQWFTELDN